MCYISGILPTIAELTLGKVNKFWFWKQVATYLKFTHDLMAK